MFETTMTALLFYFLPTLIAKRGRRRSVFVLNLLLGWTILFWVLALYMAMRSRENVPQRGDQIPPY